MTNKRISELDAIAGVDVAGDDLFVLVDVSDVAMAPSGTDKRITATDLAVVLGSEGGGTTDLEPVKWIIYSDDNTGPPPGMATAFDGYDDVALTITSLTPAGLPAPTVRDVDGLPPTPPVPVGSESNVSAGVQVGDRVLWVALSSKAGGGFNAGVYTVTDLGSESVPYVLTRAADLDTLTELQTVWTVTVEQDATLDGNPAINPIRVSSTWYLSSDGVSTAGVGFLSVEWGVAAHAAGAGAAALGSGTVAVGFTAAAPGFAAVAIGWGAVASGDNSTAIGTTATATAEAATAIGLDAIAAAVDATAIGYQTTASAPDSTAIGAYVEAAVEGVTVIGGPDGAVLLPGVTSYATSTVAVAADAGKWIGMENTDPVTFTIPPDVDVPFPIGTHFDLFQTDAGAVTVTAGAGVTLGGTVVATADQWDVIHAVKLSVDFWLVYV